MAEMARTFCRICLNCCSLLVELDANGQAVRISGDPSSALHGGFTCVKGRGQATDLRSPRRLKTSLKRQPNGEFVPISTERAIEEIADRLVELRSRFGPRAIASYWGTMAVANATVTPMLGAFMSALGSPMQFTPNTIDKPGKAIAKALHGSWQAPAQGFDRPEVALIIGMNPLVSFQGMPTGNPSAWLKRSMNAGMKLIVVDPRTSEVARRATLHLKVKPGTDAAVLACLLNVIISEGLADLPFVAEHAVGFAELTEAVRPFSPARVADIADVLADDLLVAARMFGAAQRGYAVSGTGPSMSGPGTLIEYLILNLTTVCGRWLRAGEVVRNPGVLRPLPDYRAAVEPPRPPSGFGEQLRVRGLGDTVAGMPTAALADEMLMPGPGRVRALISCAGNPVAAWPDQQRTVDALRSLDLLVQIDPFMSQTSRLANYVIAPTMALESPGITVITDYGTAPHLGPVETWAHYTDAVSAPPEDSDLIAEWDFFYRLAQRMGLQLVLAKQVVHPIGPFMLDMKMTPTEYGLLEMLTSGSRINLATVRDAGEGRSYDEAVKVRAGPRRGAHRFQLADPQMLTDLGPLLADRAEPAEFPFRMICRRTIRAYNSSCINSFTHRDRMYNPAYLHPADLAELELGPGDVVRISSRHASIEALVDADPALRRGTVSMSHCYGGLTGEPDAGIQTVGSNTSRLLSAVDDYDRISGQPRMSNVPVRVSPRR